MHDLFGAVQKKKEEKKREKEKEKEKRRGKKSMVYLKLLAPQVPSTFGSLSTAAGACVSLNSSPSVYIPIMLTRVVVMTHPDLKVPWCHPLRREASLR